MSRSDTSPPVIRSLLETDLYKFTMWQAMLHRHPQAQAEYRFACRNTPQYPLATLVADLERELDHLCALTFRPDELDYLRGLRFMKPDFIDLLRIFRFQRDFISVRADGERLEIIVRGPQVHVMGFEIFVLAMVNELYFRRFDAAPAIEEGRRRLKRKVETVRAFVRDEAPRRHPFQFFDFGLRRRFSGAWHEEVLRTLRDELPETFRGTSNVLHTVLRAVETLSGLWLEFMRQHLTTAVALVLLLPASLALDVRLSAVLVILGVSYVWIGRFVMQRTEANQKAVEEHHHEVFRLAGNQLEILRIVKARLGANLDACAAGEATT